MKTERYRWGNMDKKESFKIYNTALKKFYKI